MKKHKQPDGLLPGIYFDLDEEVYHGDPALSHSGMKNLLIHPHQYWHYSPLNPNRAFKVTDAMTFGKQCHMNLLQPEHFFNVYTVHGMGYAPGKKIIARADYTKIEEAVNMIKAVPDAYDYFQNGYAEVSIFWICPRTKLRLKMRVDYLRFFGCIDLKRSKEIENNPLGWTITEHAYDIQCALYKEGIKQIKSLLRKGKAVIHNCPDDNWLNKFIADPDNMFVFFFQRTTSPYVFRILHFDDEIMDMANIRIENAKDIYQEYVTRYGANPWPAGKPEIEEFSIYHLPRRFIDQGA